MTARLKRNVKAAQHLTVSVGAAPLLLAAALVLPCPSPGAATIGGIGVLCPMQRFLHLPCPGCGITRSVVATAHGQLTFALAFHPVGPLIFIWVCYYTVGRIPALQRKLPVIAPAVTDAFMALVVVVLITVWVLRLQHVIPGPTVPV